MTRLERLMAEELPTGKFGDAEPAPERVARSLRPSSPADAAKRRADLEAAISRRKRAA